MNRNRDQGSVLLLAIGGVLLVLLVVLVLADTSSLFMRRTALMAVADTTAIAAAYAVDVAAIYEGGVGDVLALDKAEAVRLAERAVAQVEDPRLADVRLDSVNTDGDGVTVVVSAEVPAPLSRIIGDRTVRLRARASAAMPTRL